MVMEIHMQKNREGDKARVSVMFFSADLEFSRLDPSQELIFLRCVKVSILKTQV